MNRGTHRLGAALITQALACLLLVVVSPSSTADHTDHTGQRVSDVEQPAHAHKSLPGGGKRIFGKRRFLTAYYGTAGTSSLGVLGETSADRAFKRIVRSGRPMLRRGERLMPVYELIVTVADGSENPDAAGDHSHDILHSHVQSYIDAAHRNGALLLLDLQPGRTDFLETAKRWQWALEDPWVGLALDPEWRVGPDEVPGQVYGSVSAREINRTAGWLSRLTRSGGLPEKLLVLHQFQRGMIPDIGKVRQRDGLAIVQHVDGFGSPADKLATYANVARPRKFTMGFKIFLDEDQPRMRPRAVRRLSGVRFVSFQ
ncbi:hypothetical protein [Nocardioides piscis]|uniref:Uncharacterized protein n=1 Tax=Nocardioides piscis TaxID=2714938 RepID=A0A6G7YHE8_9ACTN|nr:hypothetical protein [Nocardioides piscis]QIK76232.1 hypothetical protein G7071_13145 [Nocardioides piscis]